MHRVVDCVTDCDSARRNTNPQAVAFDIVRMFANGPLAVPQDYVEYIRRDKRWRSKGNPMKLLFVLAMSPLALVMTDAAEQDIVNRCATMIREFQQMPEKAIPRDDDAAVGSAKRRYRVPAHRAPRCPARPLRFCHRTCHNSKLKRGGYLSLGKSN